MSPFTSSNAQKFYINGAWVDPVAAGEQITVYNPNDGSVLGAVQAAGPADVDAAIAAANAAFEGWSQTPPKERADMLDAIGVEMGKRRAEFVDTVCAELGCPRHLTDMFHVAIGIGIWGKTAQLVRDFPWESQIGGAEVLREAIGPVGVLTPWNGPVTSVAKKIAAALGAGCTTVSKPSENTPFSALLIAEAIDAAGVPAGVVNMVQGYGTTVGAQIAAHDDIAAITLTGSVGAGQAISRAGAGNLKKLCLELGGKSANILLDDEGFQAAVKGGVIGACLNTGQVCFAPTRMLVPKHRLPEAEAVATAVIAGLKVAPAEEAGAMIGPLISAGHRDRVVGYIQIGIDEGAKLVVGGVDTPEGLDDGYFVKPTVFSNVTNDMRIAREEIFGPVLSIITYDDLDDAVAIANDSAFGLAAHISGQDKDQVGQLARRLRAGSIYVNGATMNFDAPFGGYKLSGQGREHGNIGLEEFLETKAIVGL